MLSASFKVMAKADILGRGFNRKYLWVKIVILAYDKQSIACRFSSKNYP